MARFGVFLVLSIVTAGALASECNLPPNLWCSSPATAAKCKVVEQCAGLTSLAGQPVNLTLYYESLCPDCQRFFRQQLYPTWKLIPDIMNLELVPFGNAEESWDGHQWKFSCQHGPEECRGNVIETCALKKVADFRTVMPFLACMEDSPLKPNQSAPQCAKKFQLDYSVIETCANGAEGNSLEHEMAVKTSQLQPAHEYVPWVTVNGVHTESLEQQAEADLLKLICDTYQGTKPPACSTLRQPCFRKKFSRGDDYVLNADANGHIIL